MITSYEELLESLVRAKVEFVLVGGLAVALNGFVRTTDDVDILVDNSPPNIARLAECLKHFGEGFGGGLTSADLTNEPGAVRIQEDFDLDIFVQMNGKGLAELSRWIDFHPLKSGVKIPFLRAAGLIETKRGSPREKDRVDIGALLDLSREGAPDRAAPMDLDALRPPSAPPSS